MPEELSPGYTACTSCGRVIASVHVNTSGRCSECAGKTADQLEDAQSQPVGNEIIPSVPRFDRDHVASLAEIFQPLLQDYLHRIDSLPQSPPRRRAEHFLWLHDGRDPPPDIQPGIAHTHE